MVLWNSLRKDIIAGWHRTLGKKLTENTHSAEYVCSLWGCRQQDVKIKEQVTQMGLCHVLGK